MIVVSLPFKLLYIGILFLAVKAIIYHPPFLYQELRTIHFILESKHNGADEVISAFDAYFRALDRIQL